jgi:type III secretory pathway component EscR
MRKGRIKISLMLLSLLVCQNVDSMKKLSPTEARAKFSDRFARVCKLFEEYQAISKDTETAHSLVRYQLTKENEEKIRNWKYLESQFSISNPETKMRITRAIITTEYATLDGLYDDLIKELQTYIDTYNKTDESRKKNIENHQKALQNDTWLTFPPPLAIQTSSSLQTSSPTFLSKNTDVFILWNGDYLSIDTSIIYELVKLGVINVSPTKTKIPHKVIKTKTIEGFPIDINQLQTSYWESAKEFAQALSFNQIDQISPGSNRYNVLFPLPDNSGPQYLLSNSNLSQFSL